MSEVTTTQAGSDAIQMLVARIAEISNDTCLSLGEDADGRDYGGMAAEVEASLRANVTEADSSRRAGYLLALAKLLCDVADGCAPSFSVNEAAHE